MGEPTPRELKVDVAAIEEELADTIDVELEFPLEPVVLGSETFTPVAPAVVDVLLTYTGTGIVATGTVSAEFSAECSRCLEPFVLKTTGDVEGFYIRHGIESEIPEEQDAEQIVGREIDLLPALRAALTLSLPFAPLHSAECAGICPTCGADLAEGSCSCEPDRSSSPFAALKDIVIERDDEA